MKLWALLLSLALLLPGILGCQQEPAFSKGDLETVATPEVLVTIPEKANLVDHQELSGWTEAAHRVELVAPASGVLIETAAYSDGKLKDFEEGAPVSQGDLLFVIARNAPAVSPWISLRVRAREAAAKLEELQQSHDRLRRSLGTRFATSDEGSQAAAKLAEAKSLVSTLGEDLAQARKDLDCIDIRAPIDGLAGRRLVGSWNTVDAGESVLATLVNIESIRVCFHLDEKSALRLLRWRQDHPWSGGKGKVEVGLVDEDGYPHQGELEFLDSQIDRATGTAMARAVIPNKTGLFCPGLYVRVRLPMETSREVLLIEEQAIRVDVGGKYVLVVTGSNTVEQRYVDLGPLVDGKRAIRSRDASEGRRGLAPDDRVVLAGLDRAVPRQRVEVVAPGSQSAPESQESAPDETTTPQASDDPPGSSR